MTNSESKYNILIVDDVPENFQMISGILYQQKINISIAQSGKEALKAVVHKPPDLILLDIIMPEMNGMRSLKGSENSWQSAVSSQQLAVGSQQSAVGSRQSAVGSRQLAEVRKWEF